MLIKILVAVALIVVVLVVIMLCSLPSSALRAARKFQLRRRSYSCR